MSPVGWLYRTLEDTLHAAELTAEVTHNHPEGIKGAQAIAASVFLARAGASKEEILIYAAKFYGERVFRTLDQIRPGYVFDVSCQGSVPEAIIAFYESESYEAAGYAMTMNNKFDVCVRYFLSTGRYNIVADNIIQDENEMPLLGAKA